MRSLSYAKAARDQAEHGMGFGEFEDEGYGKEDDAVEAKDENSKKYVSMGTKLEEKAAARGSSEKRSNPDLNQKRSGEADVAGGAPERALEERELDPGSDARGNGKTGDTPTLLNAEEPWKRQRRKIAEARSENHANDSKAKGGASGAQCVEAGGVETSESGSEEADSRASQNSPDVDDVGVGEATGLINR